MASRSHSFNCSKQWGPYQMTTNTNDELSAEQEAFVRNVVSDPVLFANHILGVSLWEREVEILRSIKTHRRTAVKACHGVGKTFSLAVAALWWLARYQEGIVLITSSTQRQVRIQLWSEIHRAVAQARVPYPKLKTTELTLRDNSNFAIGFSTNQAENFRFLEKYRSCLSTVRVDSIGVGHNFGLHLQDQGFPVELVNVSIACAHRPELADNNPTQ